MKADRVWLIVHNEPKDNAGQPFSKLITESLKERQIELRLQSADRTDLFDTLRALRKIIFEEANNAILINVSSGSKIQKLPEYKIQTPPDNLIKCLEIVYQWKNYRISNKDLRDQALEKNLIHVERHEHREQSAYMALKTNLLEPLLKWQYIRVDKIGRRHDIILTTEGLNVLKFLYTEETLDQ